MFGSILKQHPGLIRFRMFRTENIVEPVADEKFAIASLVQLDLLRKEFVFNPQWDTWEEGELRHREEVDLANMHGLNTVRFSMISDVLGLAFIVDYTQAVSMAEMASVIYVEAAKYRDITPIDPLSA